MHIFFSGIGGTGIGPLAMIAQQAGHSVSGSDKQNSDYVAYLRSKGITNIHIGQDATGIASTNEKQPIDWFVYSSAVAIENPDGPELTFCQQNNIKTSKRDELLNKILSDNHLDLIAIAGTHGKSTTTAMAVWLAQKVNVATGHLLPAKTTFCEMGHFEPEAKLFIYECDEFDRNFLSYQPHLSLISGIDYDHPDIYPTRSEYEQAFRDFIGQSQQTILWQSDFDRLQLVRNEQLSILDDNDYILNKLSLIGSVNRRDAWLVVQAFHQLTKKPIGELIEHMNQFPGLSRRFEAITPGIYSDYAHTPEKIRGALSTAEELSPGKVVVVYEGLHNTRQHFIAEDLVHLFDSVKQLYVVPSYLAREDESLELLSPIDIIKLTAHPEKGIAADMNPTLKEAILAHQQAGDLVVCLTAGGGNSLDEWLRKEFKS